MTEDDTFRVLSRPNLNEIRRIYIQWTRNNRGFNIEDRDKLFISHKWTVQEFINAHKKSRTQLPHD